MNFAQQLTFPLLLALAFGSTQAMAQAKADSIAVVCSASCTYSPLSREDVESAWSGRKSNESLRGAELWDLPEPNPAQGLFLSKALSKDSAQYRAMWAKNVFNGKGRPPRVAPDEEALMKTLGENPSAIGYMSQAAAEKKGLKILASF